MQRSWDAPFGVDVGAVLSVHRRGHGDPAFCVDADGAIWRACRTPEGPGTLRLAWRSGDRTRVSADAWGPGAEWLLESVPDALGAADRPQDFVPHHDALRQALRLHPAVRIGRTGLVLDSLVPAVLEQKVVGAEATRSWRLLLRRFGDPAPGPVPIRARRAENMTGRPVRERPAVGTRAAGGVATGCLIVPPSAKTWASIPSWEWHRAGVEAVRARTIAAAARVAPRMEEVTVLSPDAADRRLQAVPGIGPWTSAEVRQRACGDADAVSVGDYHLPSIVGWALAGKIVDDDGMLELLAPYGGHRHRACVLAGLAGLAGQRLPRRGPRLAARDFRAF